MPQELPGFYYDAEKNRYFPIKGPIPGSQCPRPSASSSTSNPQKPSSKNIQATNIIQKTRVRISKLLQGRELYGKVTVLNKGKCNFMEEVLKIRASEPVVWKYQHTKNISDGALELIHVDKNTPVGQSAVDVLVSGGVNGYLSFFEVGKVGQHFDNDGIKCLPDRVWPVNEEDKTECSKAPGHIWRAAGVPLEMPSSISCIKLCGRHSHSVDSGFNNQRAMITTLGGSVCILNLLGAFDFNSTTSMRRSMHEVASFGCTIWTADCNPNASQLVIGSTQAVPLPPETQAQTTGRHTIPKIKQKDNHPYLIVAGTNRGAALVNMETGAATWVCQSKSDVLAQTFDESGNTVLCGLRNGAIVSVDIRESSNRLIKHMLPYSPMGRKGQNYGKKWFEVKGNIHPFSTIYMPSSICSLVSLQSYDQYFLASSMDGSIKLYDHRMTKRGSVQSYEGHVNSHTRLQLEVDHSERFLTSGGEDCLLRVWSIKSGKLLFAEKFSDSILSTVCSGKSERFSRAPDHGHSDTWETWCGSREGLFSVRWP